MQTNSTFDDDAPQSFKEILDAARASLSHLTHTHREFFSVLRLIDAAETTGASHATLTDLRYRAEFKRRELRHAYEMFSQASEAVSLRVKTELEA